jgi:hypothetical protein
MMAGTRPCIFPKSIWASIFHLPKTESPLAFGRQRAEWLGVLFISEARPRRHAMRMVMMAVVVTKKHHEEEGSVPVEPSQTLPSDRRRQISDYIH